MNTSYILLENASRRYEMGESSVEALKYATCAVRPKDRVALVGPSGSGKSSLLHIMAGLDMPTSGVVTWPLLGNRESLRPSQIGFIPQSQSLVTSLNTIENIALPLVLVGRSFEDARETAQELIIQLGLAGIAEKLPDELSGGQLQRAAAARALIAGPKVILADEPTGQLDHFTADHFLHVLFEYLKGTDTALVIATHDMEVAERMDKKWEMNFGTLEVLPE